MTANPPKGDPAKAVVRVLLIMVAAVAAILLAGLVPLGFKTGMIAACALAIIRGLWPMQIDVDALTDPQDPGPP